MNYDIIIGGLIGFLSAFIISRFNNKDSNERLEKQLSQSEKNLKMQLLHNDQNRLLNELYGWLHNDKFDAFNEVINGFRGEILPEEFKRNVRREFESYYQWYSKNTPVPTWEEQHPDFIDDLWDYEEMKKEEYKKLLPHERFEIDLRHKKNQLKASAETHIRKAMKKEY